MMMTTPTPRFSSEGSNPHLVEDVGNRGGNTPHNNPTTVFSPFLLTGDGKQTARNNKFYELVLAAIITIASSGGCAVLYQRSSKDKLKRTPAPGIARISAASAGGRLLMEDGDECAGNNHGCAHTCITNNDGGFHCECGIGFTTEGGDGFECLEDMCYSGNVLSERRIDGKTGNFGRSVAVVGDLDGNGVVDMAVGALLDADGGTSRGAVYILFMKADGSVKEERKISSTQGGLLVGSLDDKDYFGVSMAALGDLDGDGVMDLAVGAYSDDGGGKDRGAVYILFLKAAGSVKEKQKISSTQGGLGPLHDGSLFGYSVAAVGDLDGDEVVDLAVGAVGDSDGGSAQGAVYILFMKADGTVKEEQKISSTQGGLVGPLYPSYSLGGSVVAVGDLDGDGVVDLAVGAIGDNGDGGSFRGAVYILFMKADGSVKEEQKISSTHHGGLVGPLHDNDYFGGSVAAMGDLNGDGVVDLAVGAYAADDGGNDRGAVYILLLNVDGTVKREQKISSTQDPALDLDDSSFFGAALTVLGDRDGNGVMSLVVGADSANMVFVIEVPPGFGSPVCAPADKSTCTNTVDGFVCECDKGFTTDGGDGAECLEEHHGGLLSFSSWSGWVMAVGGAVLVVALVVAGGRSWFRKKRRVATPHPPAGGDDGGAGVGGRNNDDEGGSHLLPSALLKGGGWRGVTSSSTTRRDPPPSRNELAFESQWIQGQQHPPQPRIRDASSTSSSSTWHINPDEVQIGVGLGEGFFGATYRARWRGEDVVVKKFKAGVRDGDEANFLAELNILRTLRHPRIVQFLGASLQKENMFLVMELMVGGSLQDVFVRRRAVTTTGGGGASSSTSSSPLTPGSTPHEQQKRKRSVLRDIAAGMMYLHQQRPVVLHRDLNSGNVLLDDRWRAKVADFGVSKQVFVHAGPDATARYYGGGGGVAGNVIYTAPEVLRGGLCNTASDVYSFAVVAWELFAEVQPFDGIPVDQLVVNLATQDHFRPPFEPLAAAQQQQQQQAEVQEPIIPGMTSTLRFHLEQWWHSDPAERPSFEQIVKGLDEWAG